MNDEQFVVLGVARPRTPWLAEVGRWATSSTLPIEFVRCVSVDEVRARLLSDRRHSAVLLDEHCLGLDRDVIGAARDARSAPMILTDSPERRDWSRIGAACVLPLPLEPGTLLAALREHALGIERRPILSAIDTNRRTHEATAPGRLIVTIGGGGSGTSTTAMAIAGHLSRADEGSSDVALIDACLDADQALLHDLGDVVPGLQELIELHRSTNPEGDAIRSHLWYSPSHGYDVLPGLRRHRDWASIRRRATLAALDSIRHSYSFVVADADADIEGEPETGSIDIEDRNLMARELTRTADVIVVTARPGVSGIHRLIRTLTILDERSIGMERVLPVVIGAPRSRSERSNQIRAITRLFTEIRPDSELPTPVMVPFRRDLEPFLRDGSGPPQSSVGSITSAVDSMLRRLPIADSAGSMPTPIIPGHLGRSA